MEYGREPHSHRMPRELKQNFKGQSEVDINGIQTGPGYIEEYYGKKTALEQRRSDQSEKKRIELFRQIKRCMCIGVAVAIFVILAVAILCTCLYFFTCVFGNCPVGCYDCQYTEGYWKKYSGKESYVASKRHCDDVYVDMADSSFAVSSSSSVGGSKKDLETSAPLFKGYTSDSTDRIQMYWYMEQSVKNNESLKLVFSDNGEYYAGLGDFGNSFFRPKPSAANSDRYSLLMSEDEPYYFPYYLTRNANASICMFLDVQGRPIEVVVKETVTEWTVFKTDNLQFYMFSAETPFEAMQLCNEKWGELYPSPDATWREDFIVGSLTPPEIKNASETSDALATHYILSTESMEISDGAISITDEDDISDYSNVFLVFNAKQYFPDQEDDGLDLTTGNGFYAADENNTYFMDYSNSNVESILSSALSGRTTAGFLLQDGFLANQSSVDDSGWSCPDYLFCSSLSYDADETVCLAKEFGDEDMSQTINNYDATRRSVLESTGVVIESTASPGTTNIYRANLDFTVEGLTTCFYEILNLHTVGVRGVTCNMCAGSIPPETEFDETHVCKRWSQLAFLMPYVMMTNDTEPQVMTSTMDSGRFVGNNLEVRQKFGYYLDTAYREARENNQPFVYPVSMKYNDYMDDEFDNGVMIGETLFFVVVIEEPEADVVVKMPPGNWFSNGGPTLGEYILGEQEHTLSATDLDNLLFLKVGNIFVIGDPDNEGYVVVRAYQTYESSSSVEGTFTYWEDSAVYEVAIQLTGPDSNGTGDMSFECSGDCVNMVDSSADIKVSKVEIYLWDTVSMSSTQDWISFNPRGNNKWNLEYDYIQRNSDDSVEPNSVFDDWTLDVSAEE